MEQLEQEILTRIKDMMSRRHLTQMELAAELGTKQYNVSRMLSGKPFPSVVQLKRIAEVLDVSMYYLIGVQEESYRELNPDAAKVADAYGVANETIQEVIRLILRIE